MGTVILLSLALMAPAADRTSRQDPTVHTDQPAVPSGLELALDALSDEAAPSVAALADEFYRQIGTLAWASPSGREAARVIARAIDDVPDEGLPRSRFAGSGQLDRWLGQASSRDATEETRAAADTALTRAFLEYALAVARGPAAVDTPSSSARDIDVASVLASARDTGTARAAVEALPPRHQQYRELRRAMATYREPVSRPEGWSLYPSGVLLKREDHEARGAESSDEPDPKTRRAVCALRQRLALWEALSSEMQVTVCSDRAPASVYGYDAQLEAAVREFQRANGLAVDGIVGPHTAEALNTTAADRARQIAVNMDRWRQLPDDLGGRYVRVNVPAFALEFHDRGHPALRMRVVVGDRRHQTPIFDADISYLVFRPYWNIPRSIARDEIIPKAAEDPTYIPRENIQVVEGWSSGPDRVPPSDVEWDPRDFSYRLRQGPGPGNALGLVKFMFPNRYNVYLHDTNAPWLFEQHDRARSHGCIRVQHPAQLAAALLGPQGWTQDEVRSAMHGGSRQVVPLGDPVPVYIGYFTAVVRPDGQLQFAPDVYGRDARAMSELFGVDEDGSDSASVSFPSRLRPNAGSRVATALCYK